MSLMNGMSLSESGDGEGANTVPGISASSAQAVMVSTSTAS